MAREPQEKVEEEEADDNERSKESTSSDEKSVETTLEEFLQRPHQEIRALGAQIGDEFVEIADFSHLHTHCRFIAFMPQWDFLDFLADHVKRFPAFQLKIEAEARDLTIESGVVTGLLATTPGAP